MRTRTHSLGAMITAALLTASCSAIVNGKLNKKPSRPDGSVLPSTCANDMECQDGDPCNGMERCDTMVSMCVRGMAVPEPGAMGNEPAVLCDADGDGADDVCIGVVCTMSRCGDGVIAGTEDCDDRNVNPLDGCDGMCRFNCTGPADCNSVCTTGGMCTVLHRCQGATPANEGGACPRGDGTGVCRAGTCSAD